MHLLHYVVLSSFPRQVWGLLPLGACVSLSCSTVANLLWFVWLVGFVMLSGFHWLACDAIWLPVKEQVLPRRGGGTHTCLPLSMHDAHSSTQSAHSKLGELGKACCRCDSIHTILCWTKCMSAQTHFCFMNMHCGLLELQANCRVARWLGVHCQVLRSLLQACFRQYECTC